VTAPVQQRDGAFADVAEFAQARAVFDSGG